MDSEEPKHGENNDERGSLRLDTMMHQQFTGLEKDGLDFGELFPELFDDSNDQVTCTKAVDLDGIRWEDLPLYLHDDPSTLKTDQPIPSVAPVVSNEIPNNSEGPKLSQAVEDNKSTLKTDQLIPSVEPVVSNKIPNKSEDPNISQAVEDNTCKSVDGLVDSNEIKSAQSNNRGTKRKTPCRWTDEEHRKFLIGVHKCGKGDWKTIAEEYVQTRTASQVTSHAQKYFARQEKKSSGNVKRRKSINDACLSDLENSGIGNQLPTPDQQNPFMLSSSGSTSSNHSLNESSVVPNYAEPALISQPHQTSLTIHLAVVERSGNIPSSSNVFEASDQQSYPSPGCSSAPIQTLQLTGLNPIVPHQNQHIQPRPPVQCVYSFRDLFG